ncbi:hypothetical protein [Streptomyces sp. NPDC088357]|uniref:hypothetical protein n=1 Tax=Streptomyces sp. NPDC088357 TaxID=3154655 RepID=UPI003435F2E9
MEVSAHSVSGDLVVRGTMDDLDEELPVLSFSGPGDYRLRAVRPWKTVYERHRLWSADGTWERLLQQVQAAAGAQALEVVDGEEIKLRSFLDNTWRRAVRLPAERWADLDALGMRW